MMCNMEKAEIETRLNEQIDSITLLKETNCSFLYYTRGKREYVLKKSKEENISEEFDNHRKIYECWFREKENLRFKIPEIYFLSSDRKFYLMEYIENGISILDVLLRGKNDINELFRRAGECINQYHWLVTKYLAENKRSMLVHNTIRLILDGKAGNKIRRCLDEFGDDTYKIIFKDFTPSNIVLDQNKNVYFLDFQKIYYYAPFYYDLARFIDTGKVFSLVHKPLFFLLNSSKIDDALKSFLDGYDSRLDKACLKRMHYVHRKEHIQMKLNKNWFDSIILRIIYWLI